MYTSFANFAKCIKIMMYKGQKMKKTLISITLLSFSTFSYGSLINPSDLSKQLGKEGLWTIKDLGKGEWQIIYKKYGSSRCSGTLKCEVEGTTAFCQLERNPNSPCLMAFGMSTYHGTVKAKKIEKAD